MNVSGECKDSKKLDRVIVKKRSGKLDLAEFKIYHSPWADWLIEREHGLE